MFILEINNKEIWENFLSQCEEKTFLDSWNWGEFQKKEGNKVWRFGVYDNNELIASALIVKITAKRGTFIFVPHAPSVILAKEGGPLIKSKILEILLDNLKSLAKEEKASFIRIAPIWKRDEENIKIFRKLGFRNAPIHIHPEITWELDIIPSEETLLMGMRKTTRYLIRQAQKNQDIEIVKSKNIDDLKKFNNIYSAAARRHKFTPFSLDYLRNQFSSLLEDDQILILFGKYKNEIVSSAIVVYWQGIGFYHHGASLVKYNKIPVFYLLQWEVIKEAKRRGCKLYNFWGITKKGGKHPWAGLTLFKMGFGGYKKEYVKTQDFSLSQSYWLTYIFEKIRKAKRGL